MENKVKTIEVVSLSRGILGEPFMAHELAIGMKRLKAMGLKAKFSRHALKGLDYLRDHPEKRAEDLIGAYADPETDMILCAIGGDDTYRLLPFLFEEDQLKKVVDDKIFLGFSDTTMNHFMLHKLGARTFYGQSFLPDVCELEQDMLPYSRKYFEELVSTGTIKEIRPSDLWFEERQQFDESQIGVPRIAHKNNGFKLLQGPSVFSGKILGGCIETMYDIFNNERHEDSVALCEKYKLFPSLEDWTGRILLLESSEGKTVPDLYKKMLGKLKEYGIFEVVSGVLVGKPMDEAYSEEYQKLLVEIIDKPDLPVLYDINVGHATPRCIIPFGVDARVDADKQVIYFSGKEAWSNDE